MYFLLTNTDAWGGYVSTSGVCTCGEIFEIHEFGKTGCYFIGKELEKDPSSLRCPKCGATYGLAGVGTYGNHQKKVHLYSAKPAADGKRITIRKEIAELRTDTLGVSSYHSYEMVVSSFPSMCVEYIKKDDTGTKVTMGRIASCLRYVSDKVLKQCGPLGEEIAFICKALVTTSAAKGFQTILEYPVLDTIYQTYMVNQQCENPANLQEWIKEAITSNRLIPGEKSMRKAFGMPKSLCNLTCGKLSLEKAVWTYQKFGPGLAENVITATSQVISEQEPIKEFREFAEFYGGLTTAERERIMTYLLHDVNVYQGIESPSAAWDILKDYRRMCEDMELSPTLCPKSLKLQHDITARNYKLCLDEVKLRKFQAAVAAENYQRLTWTSRDGAWAVLIPEKPDDMVEEGRRQSHCVASYIGEVSNGTCRICFLRKSDDLTRPVLTLTVNAEDCCQYYKGFDNREATEEERKVLQEWTTARKLTLSANG